MAELQEVLESETHVDMEKLVSLAQHQGVPDELRAEAWKYMLGVARPERAEEMSLRKRMEVEFKDIENAWRSRLPGEVARTVKVCILYSKTKESTRGGVRWCWWWLRACARVAIYGNT